MSEKAKNTQRKTAARDEHLPYGQGQREQYGEGYAYRQEELSKAADKSTDHRWAGGDHSENSEGIPETEPRNKKRKSN